MRILISIYFIFPCTGIPLTLDKVILWPCSLYSRIGYAMQIVPSIPLYITLWAVSQWAAEIFWNTNVPCAEIDFMERMYYLYHTIPTTYVKSAMWRECGKKTESIALFSLHLRMRACCSSQVTATAPSNAYTQNTTFDMLNVLCSWFIILSPTHTPNLTCRWCRDVFRWRECEQMHRFENKSFSFWFSCA